jgi:2-polyprenyl-6-hydroxyphenyl methylase/3-demethylubiquinone-9 3-methyltransferase
MTNNHSLNEIHAASLMDEMERLLAIDARNLLAHRDQFVDGACPACGSHDRERAYETMGFQYARCTGCATVYMSPAYTSALYLDHCRNGLCWRYWREEMSPASRATREKLHRNRADYVFAACRELNADVGRILEIGGGLGELTELLASSPDVSEVVNIEPQPFASAHPKVQCVVSSFEDASLDRPVDVVVAFEVLEHILDPAHFLAKAQAFLKPGGLLILSTPNVNGFEIDVLGSASTTIAFDHSRLYNPTSLRHLLERTGFEVCRLVTPGQLDTAMVKRKFDEGKLSLDHNPALEFLLSECPHLHEAFQQFLQRTMRSTHMRCVARRI